jgi:AcrR family transcriptional regulator
MAVVDLTEPPVGSSGPAGDEAVGGRAGPGEGGGVGGREAAKQETRAALISAALAEFAERGFDAPSLDAICRRAGFTRGAFYVHFKSREELVVAVMESVLTRLLDTVIGADSAHRGDLARTVDLYVAHSTRGRDVLDQPDATPEGLEGDVEQILLHRLLEACERAPSLRERLRSTLCEAMERLADVAERERDRGRLRDDVAARDLSSLLILLALGLRVATDLSLPIAVAPVRRALDRLLAPVAPERDARIASRKDDET